jgi:cell fate (sporulation/competence/biofilm development) regulator YlbF (YheA/YmcA/DUF963 family)
MANVLEDLKQKYKVCKLLMSKTVGESMQRKASEKAHTIVDTFLGNMENTVRQLETDTATNKQVGKDIVSTFQFETLQHEGEAQTERFQSSTDSLVQAIDNVPNIDTAMKHDSVLKLFRKDQLASTLGSKYSKMNQPSSMSVWCNQILLIAVLLFFLHYNQDGIFKDYNTVRYGRHTDAAQYRNVLILAILMIVIFSFIVKFIFKFTLSFLFKLVSWLWGKFFQFIEKK